MVEAEKRYGRIFQIGTYGRFGANRQDPHKIMASGLLKECDGGAHPARRLQGQGVERQGRTYKPQPVPAEPRLGHVLRPGAAAAVPPRIASAARTAATGTTRAAAWPTWASTTSTAPATSTAKDDTSPVEIEALRPAGASRGCRPVGLGRAEVRRRLDPGARQRRVGRALRPQASTRGVEPATTSSEEDRKKLKAMPDPEPLLSFAEAVKTRKPAGGHAEAAHRAATLCHLANIAIRMRPQAPLRPGQGADHRRRGGQPAGQPAHAGARGDL